MPRPRWIIYLDRIMISTSFFIVLFGLLAVGRYLQPQSILPFLLAPAGAVIFWLVYDNFARWKKWPREEASWAQIGNMLFDVLWR